MGAPQKTGKSKQLQLKDWERYFDFKRDGQKFIIVKIYDVPLPKKIKSNNIYINDVLVVLNDYLLKNKVESIEITKNRLLVVCGFLNSRHLNKADSLRLFFQSNKYSEKQIKYYYNFLNKHITNYCKKYIERSLQSLSKKGYIRLYEYHKIVCGAENQYRRANEKEELIINKIEKEKELEFKPITFYNEQKYYNAINKELIKFGIKECYKTYCIVLIHNINNLGIEDDANVSKNNINQKCLEAFYKQIDKEMPKHIINDLKRNDILLSEEIAEHFDLMSIEGINQENKFQYYEYIKDLKKSLVDYFIKI